MARGRGYYGYGSRNSGYGEYGGFAPYVPVAQRRAKALAYGKTLEKKEGRKLAPVKVEGRTIASSFWGKAWCDNLEAYSDFANRLPRGRTYVRNGSVIDLSIAKGEITALVSGSAVYSVTISIDTLPPAGWQEIQRDCARSIASLIDLLQGRFDRGVMQRLTQTSGGLFPKPKEIKMRCSCPDSAFLCKHLAAVMYGVGARLDHSPELLFTLRNVDHLDLIGQAVAAENLDDALRGESSENLAAGDLSELFGIELESSTTAPPKSAHPSSSKPHQANTKRRAAKTRRSTEATPVTQNESRTRRSRSKPVKATTKASLHIKSREKQAARTAGNSKAKPKPRKAAAKISAKSVLGVARRKSESSTY